MTDLTEAQFQNQVIDTAKAYGWRAYHTFDSRKSTPGFPDLVLVRDRVVFLELKSATGRVSDAQSNWIADLRKAGQLAYVMRPADFDRIVRLLK